MAAEIVLTFVVEELLKNVATLAIDGVSRAWGLKKDLEKLSESTKRIQALLQEAYEKQASDERVRSWLLRLQDVVYSAEDALDEFSYETLRHKVEIQAQLRRKIRNFVSTKNPILFHLNMANKVKNINETLADIENQALRELALRSVAVVSCGAAPSYQLDRETDSLLDKSETLVGRMRDVETIINMLQLIRSSNPPLLSVASIVGIGGLGKTTLAKLVLEEVKEKNMFDCALWVCVSDSFDDKTILRGMLESLSSNTNGLTTIEAILRVIQEKLANKRFILVLDDVWNEDPRKWDSLKGRLQKICQASGNVIIVTTRSRGVANANGTSAQHILELKQLEDEECWSIIKEKVYREGKLELISKEMEDIGIEIAKKCGGVPLVAKVLGGTLCSKRKKEEWLSIQNSSVWDAAGENNGILSVLKLSFDNLHPSLKPCFAYCALFPKDFVFEKKRLVQLWMAEGFLNTASINGATRSAEDVGDSYFNGLLSKSFFQDVEMDELGNISQCKMHDLLHDLALFVSNTTVSESNNGSVITHKTSDGRRLNVVIDQERQPGIEFAPDERTYLRSLLSNVDVFHMVPSLKGLRCLDVSNSNLQELPATIGKLKNLRYLDVSGTEITALPKSITKLYKLQTLKLLNCWCLVELPNGISNMVSLRHFLFTNSSLTPSKMSCLTSLQTLTFFLVRKEDGYKISELEGLNELRGKLRIVNLNLVKDAEEAKRSNLKGKKLSKLRLIWEQVFDNDDTEREGSSSSKNCNHEDVLEALVPPPSLQSLIILRYLGNKFPQWMSMKISGNVDSVSPFNELVKLKLMYCRKCVIIPTLGHLPHLKILKIRGMDSLEFIGNEFYGESNRRVTVFPALEKLSICDMDRLVGWTAPTLNGEEGNEPQRILLFPSLQELCIERCPRLTIIPWRHLSSLVTLTVSLCHELQHLSDEFHGLPHLEWLEVVDCLKLVFIPSLPSVKRIHISGCFRLASLPMPMRSLERLAISSIDNLPSDAFRGLSSLEYLSLVSWNSMDFPSVEDLISLKSLKVASWPSLTSLSTLRISDCEGLSDSDDFSALTCLKELCISNCPKLTRLPQGIKFCTSLRKLNVQYCQGLISISEDIISSLTRLKDLAMGPFSKELEEFPGIHHINPSLEKLQLGGWGKLKSLPHQLQRLMKLKKLELEYFNEVEALPDWLAHLSSLQTLKVWSCRNLKNLPTTLKQLSNLTSLMIYDCPLLKERCSKDIGHEWPNISHVPCIYIDSETIHNLKS